jgi:fatty-acyl-CoA synthase
MLGDATRWISRWGELQPEKPAIVERDRETSWAEFAGEVSRAANAFRDLGVEPGDRIGCLMGNRREFLATVFGAMRAGAVFVPLNTRLAGPELAWTLADCEPKLVVAEAAFAGLLPDDEGTQGWIDVDGTLPGARAWDDLLGAADRHFEVSVVDPSAPASICYTSGTTGRPKGAVFTHEAMARMTSNVAFTQGWTRHDRQLIFLPLCFAGGLLGAGYPCLSLGQTLILEKGFDRDRIGPLVEAAGVTLMSGVPTTWKELKEAVADHPEQLASLRFGAAGASPVPPSLLTWFGERGVRVSQCYGLTEGGCWNLCLQPEDAARKPGSAGRGFVDCEPRVVDAAGEDAGPGEAGELILRGPTLMSGYWRNAAATTEALRDGWLYTGDIATVDEEGFVSIVDRKKDVVISGGLNVYPAEVEMVLDDLPGVADAAVIGLPDPKWGETVTAVVVPAGEITDDEIVAHCRAALAGYKVPRRVEFVEEIAKTASNKHLKQELRRRLGAPSSASSR